MSQWHKFGTHQPNALLVIRHWFIGNRRASSTRLSLMQAKVAQANANSTTIHLPISTDRKTASD
jgi:hypothetical protein